MYIVWLRDIKRVFRDRVTLIGSILRSVLWLVIMGLGLRDSFQYVGGVDYVEYIFPGIVGMAILFGSVQSAITIVWEKELGFFKELLVAPVSRTSIAAGKALSGATLGSIEALVVLVLAFVLKVQLNPSMVIKMLLIMIIVAYSLSLLGILVALRLKTFEGFGVVVNLMLMPMFFFSGALFPISTLPEWVKYVVLINPLTYGVDALRNVSVGLWDFPFVVDIAVLSLFATIMSFIVVFKFQNKRW